MPPKCGYDLYGHCHGIMRDSWDAATSQSGGAMYVFASLGLVVGFIIAWRLALLFADTIYLGKKVTPVVFLWMRVFSLVVAGIVSIYCWCLVCGVFAGDLRPELFTDAAKQANAELSVLWDFLPGKIYDIASILLSGDR